MPMDTRSHQVTDSVRDSLESRLPDHASPVLQKALTEAKARLRAIYGDRLQRVVLYGSRARGDARPDSDVDLLVVLDGPIENEYQEIKRAGAFWGDLLSRYGLSFSIKPYSEEEYGCRQCPFMRAVHKEGIEL